MVDSPSAPQSFAAAGHRVALHAFPSPTTIRFVVILAAMLAAGLFIGDWFEGRLHADQFARAVDECYLQAGNPATVGSPGEQIAIQDAAEACYANTRYVQAAYSLGGALLVMLAGLAIVFLAPPIIERRRRLRPFGVNLLAADGRIAELARQAGLRRPPTVMLGHITQRDAFSYGSPRRYRIALPPAVAIKLHKRSPFDAVVLHELAHVRNRDIGLSWLTRGVMYAIVPILALPIFTAVANTDFSLLPDYLWRAAILGLTVWMVSIALLRSREHDADLTAATLMRETDTLSALVGQARPQSETWWRRLRANHPSPATRAAVLARPQVAAAMKFLDGLAPAFLAAFAIPLVERLVTAMATANSLGGYQLLIAAGMGGLLLGGTVGIGLWRAVAVDRAVGAQHSPWIPAFGVAAGLVLGQVASLANTTSGFRGGLTQPAYLIIPAVVGLATTAVVYSLAEVSTDSVARLRSPRWAWIPGVAIASLVYFAGLYFSKQVQMVLDLAPLGFVRRTLATELDALPVIVTVIGAAAITGVALVFTRSNSLAPAWLFEESAAERPPWPTAGWRIQWVLLAGVICGACAVVPYAVYRNSVPTELNETLLLTLLEVTTWCGATAGAAASLAFVVCVPRRGLALGALAGPVAVGAFITGYWAINALDDRPTDFHSTLQMLTDGLALSLLLGLVIAPLALIPRIFSLGAGWSITLAAVVALGACTGAVAAIASAPPVTDADVVLPDMAPRLPDSMAAGDYLRGTGNQVLEGINRALTALGEIDPQVLRNEPTVGGQRIRTEVVEPLTELQTVLRAESPRNPTVAAVHADAITLIDAYITSLGHLADGLLLGDVGMQEQAAAEFDRSSLLYDRFSAGLEQLRAAAK